ncbi:MAG: cytochrome c oxidase subunit II [Chloroflexi bacterium]|nr:cytochrome c oxidase subunit II [Chloroflexota bacterium]
MPQRSAKVFLSLVVFGLLLVGCQENPTGPPSTLASALSPRGPGAEAISGLWWFMFIVAVIVYAITMGLLAIALLRRRTGAVDLRARTPRGAYSFIVIAGIVVPLIILLVLFGFTLQTMVVIASPGEAGDSDSLTIQVIGHQWWWEVRYPLLGFETANEIHIPENVPVLIRLTSADVIHSFWVPELHGKIDLIPGRTNTIWIEADSVGQFRGVCAEFCGLQHAKMQMVVVSESAEDFDLWVARQQLPAPEPDNDVTFQGQQIFQGSACVYCHTIRGTNAVSDLGPDLTHFASRLTIGAGAVPNSPGHLAGWIVDSHGIKPGNRMPPMLLDSDDLNALLAYMQTLE